MFLLTFHLGKVEDNAKFLESDGITVSQLAEEYKILMSELWIKLSITHSTSDVELQERFQFKHLQLTVKTVVAIYRDFKVRTEGKDGVLDLINHFCVKFLCIVMRITALNLHHGEEDFLI